MKQQPQPEPDEPVAQSELSPMGFAFSDSDQLEHDDELGLSDVLAEQPK
jgi:hypothetical protein